VKKGLRPSRPVRLSGVRQTNLKNITVEFPARQISVVTGLSGSGKSSLVFHTLYAAGQRRYVESLSTYTRQFIEKMPKPDLDIIENIPPAIALEQKNHMVNSRSTVGTQTEIVDYLRVLFAKVGKTQVAVEVSSVIRASDDSFRIAWTERRYVDGSLAATERWSAILTIVVQTPTDADRLKKNPLGVYVHALNWSKELG